MFCGRKIEILSILEKHINWHFYNFLKAIKRIGIEYLTFLFVELSRLSNISRHNFFSAQCFKDTEGIAKATAIELLTLTIHVVPKLLFYMVSSRLRD